MILSSLLTACAWSGSNHWKLPDVLEILKTTKTERELISRIGPPHLETTFNPGSRNDPYPANVVSRETLKKSTSFDPPSLVDTLPVGTKILVYGFAYPPSSVGGAVSAYIDDQGNILGWSYSKSLISKHHAQPARMDKRDFEK